MDEHSSLINMKFIIWADKYRIIIAIMPLHSTYQLQPLATTYSKEITTLMLEDYGLVNMTKRIFWSIFNSAFAKTGIFSYDCHRANQGTRR